MVAVVVVGVVAAKQQHGYSPIVKDAKVAHRIDWKSVSVVFWILAVAITANVLINARFGDLGERFPVLGVGGNFGGGSDPQTGRVAGA